MVNQKIRLLDTDVISNILGMCVRSNVETDFSKVTIPLKLWTTKYVENEVLAVVNKAKKTGMINSAKIKTETIKVYERTWYDLKKLFEFKESPENPSSLKNRGEQSLVDVIPLHEKDAKIVSNNKKDVYRFIEAKGKKGSKYYQSPFEFYEQEYRECFNNYKDLIKFLIISNHDFKVVKAEGLGNILTRLKD